MDTPQFSFSDSLPEWKFRITETVMTKLNENNVTYVKTLYNLWLQWIAWILVNKSNLYLKVEMSRKCMYQKSLTFTTVNSSFYTSQSRLNYNKYSISFLIKFVISH